MEKRKTYKEILRLLCILVCIIGVVGIGVLGYNYFSNSPKKYPWKVMKEWNIELPKEAKLLFKEEALGFTGDGTRYMVLELVSEEAEIFTNDFTEEKPNGLEEDIKNAFDEINNTDSEQIPDEYNVLMQIEKQTENVMSYKEIHDEKTRDRIYLVYDKGTNLLYVCEIRI